MPPKGYDKKNIKRFSEELKKKMVEFSTKCLTPLPPVSEKKNDLHTMKRILYDMGPLTLVRWPI